MNINEIELPHLKAFAEKHIDSHSEAVDVFISSIQSLYMGISIKNLPFDTETIKTVIKGHEAIANDLRVCLAAGLAKQPISKGEKTDNNEH